MSSLTEDELKALEEKAFHCCRQTILSLISDLREARERVRVQHRALEIAIKAQVVQWPGTSVDESVHIARLVSEAKQQAQRELEGEQ
jgi:hypothetical protein